MAHWRRRAARATLALGAAALSLLLAACVTTDEAYVPIDVTHRAPKDPAAVLLVEGEPDRPYMVIGMIAPPAGEYDSIAQALNAARTIAAGKGADAIIIMSADSESHVGSGTKIWNSGTINVVQVRVKAIVWK